MTDNRPAPGNGVHEEDEPIEATLVFREQADGRKVARLPGGKVVLVALADLERVKDGERWHVRLRHRETFAIADPIERERPEMTNPVLQPGLVRALPARHALPASRPEPAQPPAASVTAVPPASKTAVDGWPQEKQRPESRHSRILPSRVVGMQDRVAMFVDGANMDLACRMAGYFIDYRKARQFFLASGNFNAAYYYTADYSASDSSSLQLRYLDFLAHSDFIVRRKAVKAIRDQETGERVLKANVDIELILDLVNTADNYDLAFLFSGDSDFERAVDLLRSRGKRVYIVTSRRVVSRELAYVADKPIFFLEDFRAELEREPGTPQVDG